MAEFLRAEAVAEFLRAVEVEVPPAAEVGCLQVAVVAECRRVAVAAGCPRAEAGCHRAAEVAECLRVAVAAGCHRGAEVAESSRAPCPRGAAETLRAVAACRRVVAGEWGEWS